MVLKVPKVTPEQEDHWVLKASQDKKEIKETLVEMVNLVFQDKWVHEDQKAKQECRVNLVSQAPAVSVDHKALSVALVLKVHKELQVYLDLVVQWVQWVQWDPKEMMDDLENEVLEVLEVQWDQWVLKVYPDPREHKVNKGSLANLVVTVILVKWVQWVQWAQWVQPELRVIKVYEVSLALVVLVVLLVPLVSECKVSLDREAIKEIKVPLAHKALQVVQAHKVCLVCKALKVRWVLEVKWDLLDLVVLWDSPVHKEVKVIKESREIEATVVSLACLAFLVLEEHLALLVHKVQWVNLVLKVTKVIQET